VIVVMIFYKVVIEVVIAKVYILLGFK